MTERYSKLAVVLHWLIAIGIFLNLKSGLGFDDLPKDQAAAAFAFHESIGISVLGLVVLVTVLPAPSTVAVLVDWVEVFDGAAVPLP